MYKRHFFWVFKRTYYWVKFLSGWVLTYENQKFDLFRTVFHQKWIVLVQYSWNPGSTNFVYFSSEICGFMTFGMDFDFKVILMGRMILGMWKGWCNLFSLNFVNNNSMFSMLYIRKFEKSHFYGISCVGYLISLVNMCWLRK